MMSGEAGGSEDGMWRKKAKEGSKKSKSRKLRLKLDDGFELEDPVCGEFVKPVGRVRKGKKVRECVMISDEERSLAERLMEDDNVPEHWDMLEKAVENDKVEDVLEMEVTLEERDGLEQREVAERIERVDERKVGDQVGDATGDGRIISEGVSTEDSEVGLQVMVDDVEGGVRKVRRTKKSRRVYVGEEESECSQDSGRKKRKYGEVGGSLDVEMKPGQAEVCLEEAVVSKVLDASGVGTQIKVALNRLKDLLDILEDEGARKKLVRKCRRELDEVTERVGVLVGLNSRIDSEKVEEETVKERRVSEYVGLRVDVDVGDSVKSIATEEESKVEGGEDEMVVEAKKDVMKDDVKKKVKEDEERVEKWLKWKAGVGREDLKVVFYDCGESWTDRMMKEGLMMSVFGDGMVKKEEVEKMILERRLKDKLGKHGLVYKVNFPMMVALMSRVERKVCVNGYWSRFDIYVDATCCWKCQRYGHRAVVCDGKVRCRNCGEGHGVRECVSQLRRCVSCEDVGVDAVGHRSGSSDCVLHKKLLERKRRRMEGALQYHSDMQWKRPLVPGEELRIREMDYKRVNGRH